MEFNPGGAPGLPAEHLAHERADRLPIRGEHLRSLRGLERDDHLARDTAVVQAGEQRAQHGKSEARVLPGGQVGLDRAEERRQDFGQSAPRGGLDDLLDHGGQQDLRACHAPEVVAHAPVAGKGKRLESVQMVGTRRKSALRRRQFDLHPAQRIHQEDEFGHADERIIAHGHVEVLADGLQDRLRPRPGLVRFGKEIGGVDALFAHAGDRHPQVARDGKHADVRLERDDGGQDDRIRAPGAPALGGGICAEQEDVGAQGREEVGSDEQGCEYQPVPSFGAFLSRHGADCLHAAHAVGGSGVFEHGKNCTEAV